MNAKTTTKRTARLLANATGLSYMAARAIVNASISDLGIDRLSYNDNLRSWEISTADSARLVEMLTELHEVN